MATSTPILRPRPIIKTNQSNRNYYTLHSGANDAFTLKINEKSRTSIVGFTKWDDAIFIGKMMETHYIRQKEWPDTRSAGSLVLPSPPMGDVLHILYIQEWKFDDLKMLCTRNILDMISVDDISTRKSTYSFHGNVYRFEAPIEFYQMRFDELYVD